MKWKTDLEYKYISNQHMKLNRSSINYKLPYYYYFFFFSFGCTTQHTGSQFPNQESNLCSLQWKQS